MNEVGQAGRPFGQGDVVTVAGHICLDVIPQFTGPARLEPGTLNEVGPVRFATGGAVANVGLALDRLGVPVRLIARSGDDPYGRVLEGLLHQCRARSRLHLEKIHGESTSYSIVVSPPRTDRFFLHHPGCNDGFDPAGVDRSALEGSRILYFGYPPAMRKTYEDGGEALAALFADAREGGALTVLDMAMPDPLGASGRVDWMAFLDRVLPQVDVFMPSLEETRYMLEGRRPEGGGLEAGALLQGNREGGASWRRDENQPWELFASLSGRLLQLGAVAVVLKLGVDGLYLRTGDDQRLDRLACLGPNELGSWRARTIWSPAFRVEEVGTTGSGDATVAGFIAGLLAGLRPEQTLSIATAVGACSVEAADANSGILSWEETRDRITAGWLRRDAPRPPDGWRLHQDSGSYVMAGKLA
jgi:sugar/nucleoside kinase (ribokinase family)